MLEESKDSSRKIVALIYGILLVVGLTIYIAWGMMYDSWNILDIDHIAIYSIFVVLAGLGAVGFYLYGSNLEIK
jgi:hypothetical protein